MHHSSACSRIVSFLDLIDQIPVTDKTFLPSVQLENQLAPIAYIQPIRQVFISREISGLHESFHVDDCFVLLYVFQGDCTLTLNTFTRTMSTGEYITSF